MNTNHTTSLHADPNAVTAEIEAEVVTQISEEELANVTGAAGFPALMQTEYQQTANASGGGFGGGGGDFGGGGASGGFGGGEG